MIEGPIVTVPFGSQAGAQFPLADTLLDLAIDLLTQRTALRDQQIYAPENPAVELQRDARVADLERISAALEALAWQMLYPAETLPHEPGDYRDLARQHQVVLPDWLEERE